MKKIIFILIALAIAATTTAQKTDTTKLNEITTMKLDTMTSLELGMKVLQQDSTIKTQEQVIEQTEKELAIERAKADLFGNVPPVDYAIGLIFALIGIFINTTLITTKAIKKNEASPAKFSFSFWWQNNRARILRWIGILAVILIGMRFSVELFNKELTMFLAFGFGLAIDALVEYIKNYRKKVIPTE